MSRDIETAFGPLSPQSFSRLFPHPVQRIAEWPWDHPVQQILAFCGVTIDHVVNEVRVAREVKTFWRIWKAAERLREERACLEAEHVRLRVEAEVLWWREMGCPVPCPICEALEPCGCGKTAPYSEILAGL